VSVESCSSYCRLYRRRTATADGPPDAIASDGDRVVCPECRTANDPGYRYCRACVSALPGAAEVRQPDPNPLGGLTR